MDLERDGRRAPTSTRRRAQVDSLLALGAALAADPIDERRASPARPLVEEE